MTAPLVSIVVPVFNGADYLAECLDSLVAQDYQGEVEVVVVDDCSTDESADVGARYPRARVLRRDHEGLAPTRNAGIAASTGALIAFCDADDRYKPNKIRVQVDYLDAHP